MLPRLLRSVIALAAMFVVYQGYVLLAVPLLEPPLVVRQPGEAVSDIEREDGQHSISKYQRLLSHYFPPEHWSQQKPPMVLMNGPALLVLSSYERYDDGRVDIPQFAVLIFPTPLEEGGEAPRDAVVLEAPQGAQLQFDENFHLERGQVGQITGGKFPGPITIRSDMQEPGPSDDLLIETADILMTTKLLYTNKPVRFRLGNNVGSGRQMEIRLLEGPESRSNKLALASLEILRDVRLRVDLKTDDLLPGQVSKNLLQANQNSASAASSPPVDLTCTGPFHFDFVRYVASFDQNVRIRELNPIGPGYSLDANQLDIHFLPKSPEDLAIAADQNRRQQVELGSMEPSLVVAQGEPVVIKSPAKSAETRAARVQVHLDQRRVTLDGGRDTVLAIGGSLLKAPTIDYWHPAEDSLSKVGRFRASGPGSVYYVLDEQRPEDVFQAAWQTSVELGRSNGQPTLMLEGRPELAVAGKGRLAADRMRLTFREVQAVKSDNIYASTPNATGNVNRAEVDLIPDQLAAVGNVEITSPKLIGRTEQLLATFESRDSAASPPAASPAVVNATAPSSNDAATTPRANNQPATTQSAPTTIYAADPAPVSGGGSLLRGSSSDGAQPKTAFHVETDQMRLGVVMRGKDVLPSSLACEGHVVLREIPLVPSDKQPLEFSGGQLTAEGLDRDAARIKIIGAPPIAPGAEHYVSTTNPEANWATLSGRGMTFETAAVEVDQRDNRLWAEGPGVATIQVTKDMDGRVTAKPYPIEIRWSEGMDFDGRRAEFRGNITGHAPDSTLNCLKMIVRLAAPVDFSAPKGGAQAAADVAEIEFHDQVIINHYSRDQEGPTSHDRIRVAWFSINQQTGMVNGRGPGEIRSTRYSDSSIGLGGLGGIGATPSAASQPANSPSKLVYVRTEFDGPIKGNVYNRMVDFNDRVRMVFGPVDAWEQELDVNKPDALPPESVTILADRLQINEDPMARATRRPGGPPNGIGPVQIQAQGDVKIDARSKTQARMRADAESASYDSGKQLIVVKGSPATLWLQNKPGDPVNPLRSGSMSYSTATGLPHFDNFEGGEITLPGAAGPAPTYPGTGRRR